MNLSSSTYSRAFTYCNSAKSLPSWLTSLLVFLLLTDTLHAERKWFSPGLYGGLSLNNYYGKDLYEYDFSIRPTAGLRLAFHLPQILGIEADAMYLYKGASLKRSYGKNSGGVKDSVRATVIKAHYVEIPLMLKLSVPTDGEVHPIIMLGPSWGIKVASSSGADIVQIDNSGLITPIKVDPIIENKDIDPVDFGYVVAAGVEWGLGNLQLRLNWGKNSIDKSGNTIAKTMAISTLAGFTF